MPLMSPRCFTDGRRFVVTRMGNGSISEAQTGRTPASRPASGKPPEPSNRLPRVSFFSVFRLSIRIASILQVIIGDARQFRQHVLTGCHRRIPSPVKLLRGVTAAEGVYPAEYLSHQFPVLHPYSALVKEVETDAGQGTDG